MAELRKTPFLSRKKGQKSKGNFKSPIMQKRLKAKNQITEDIKIEVITLDNLDEEPGTARRSKRKKNQNVNTFSDENIPHLCNKIFKHDTTTKQENLTEILSSQYIPNTIIQSLDKTFFADESEEISFTNIEYSKIAHEKDQVVKNEEKKHEDDPQHSNENGTQQTCLKEKLLDSKIPTLPRNNLAQEAECETETLSKISSDCKSYETEICTTKTKSVRSYTENITVDAYSNPENGEKIKENTEICNIQNFQNKNLKEKCDNFLDKSELTEKTEKLTVLSFDANSNPENKEKPTENTEICNIQNFQNKNLKEKCDNFLDKSELTEKLTAISYEVESIDNKPLKETCITETNSQISHTEDKVTDINSNQENEKKFKEQCENLLSEIETTEKQAVVSSVVGSNVKPLKETSITETKSQKSYIENTTTDANSNPGNKEFEKNTKICEVETFQTKNMEEIYNNFLDKIDATEKENVSSEVEKIDKFSAEESIYATNLDQLYIGINKADEIISSLTCVKTNEENCTTDSLPSRNTIELSETTIFKENFTKNMLECTLKENSEKVNDLANTNSFPSTIQEQNFTNNLNENMIKEEICKKVKDKEFEENNKEINNCMDENILKEICKKVNDREFEENNKEINHCMDENILKEEMHKKVKIKEFEENNEELIYCNNNCLEDKNIKADTRSLCDMNKENMGNPAAEMLLGKIKNSVLEESNVTEPLSTSTNEESYVNEKANDKHSDNCKEEIITQENIELKSLTLFYMSALELESVKQDINKNIVGEDTEINIQTQHIQNSILKMKTDITDETLYQDNICSKNVLRNSYEQEQQEYISSPLEKNEITVDIEKLSQTKEKKDDLTETDRKSNDSKQDEMRIIKNDFLQKKEIISLSQKMKNFSDKTLIVTKENELKESLTDKNGPKKHVEEKSINECMNDFEPLNINDHLKLKQDQVNIDSNTTDKEIIPDFQMNEKTKIEIARIDESEYFQCAETVFRDKVHSKKEINLTEDLECSTNECIIYENKLNKHMEENVPSTLNAEDDFDMDDDFNLTSSQIQMIELDENKEIEKSQVLPTLSYQQKEKRGKMEFEPDSIAVEVIDQLHYIRESLESIKQSINILSKKIDMKNNLP